MKLKGKLIKKTKVEEFGSNGFKKREIVIVTDEQYPQSIMIELHQNNCDLANDLKKDETIEVSINVRGREWVNPEGVSKYFNSLVGWKIEKIQVQEQAPASSINTDDEPDDLPF